MTYFLSDGYFTDILKQYFAERGFRPSSQKTGATVCHANFTNCSDCQFTNGLADPQPINDKVRIHDSLQKAGVTDFLFPFYTINQNEGWKLESRFDGKRFWIAKPADSLRGEGIKITADFREFIVHLSQHTNYQQWLIQQYLHNPLLYRGKKCHFRVYALLKITNRPSRKLELFIYPKGYIYVADKKFEMRNFEDGEIHLTTSCNNQEFPSRYDSYYGRGEFYRLIFPQMRRIVYETVKVSGDQLGCVNAGVDNSCCYKMLAYDLIADTDKRLYLMEVNAKVIGMSSTDLPGNCKSKTPSLQTPEFKRELMRDIMDTVIYNRPKLFIRLI